VNIEYQMGRRNKVKLLLTYDDETYEIICYSPKFIPRTILQKNGSKWAVIAMDDLPFEAQLEVLEELERLAETYEEIEG
jgi:hypothetical protein